MDDYRAPPARQAPSQPAAGAGFGGGYGGGGPQAMDEEGPPPELDLRPCPSCGRKFNPKALEKHSVRCRRACGPPLRGRRALTQTTLPFSVCARRCSRRSARPSTWRRSGQRVRTEPLCVCGGGGFPRPRRRLAHRWGAGIVENSGGDPDAVRLVKKGLRQARGARAGAAAPAGSGPNRPAKAAKGAKWKRQSEALREAMRASRMVTQAQEEGRCAGRLPCLAS